MEVGERQLEDLLSLHCRAGRDRGLGSAHPPFGSTNPVWGEVGCTLEECRLGRSTTSVVGQLRGLLEERRYVFVRRRGGIGEVPRVADRVDGPIADRGQHRVRVPTVSGRHATVDRRADEGMPEANARQQPDKPGSFGWNRGVRRNPMTFGRMRKQNRIACWIGRREQQQRLGRGWERAEPDE